MVDLPSLWNRKRLQPTVMPNCKITSMHRQDCSIKSKHTCYFAIWHYYQLQHNKYASTGLLHQIEADELRHNFASNAIEDAFFVSNVQPRPVSSRNLRRRHNLPRNGDNKTNAPSLFTIDEDAEQEGDNISRERESFIRTANRMGGLSQVESVLFQDEDSSRTLHEEASFRTRRRLGLGNWISSRLPGNDRRADVALHLSTVS